MQAHPLRRYSALAFVALTAALATSAALAGSGRIPSDKDSLPKGVTTVPAVASQCLACHGPTGQSENEDWPHLAGQKQSYLLQQLQDFKSGTRQHPMMAPVVKLLSDADMRALATYFSTQAPAQPRSHGGNTSTAAAPASAAACMGCHDNAALPTEPFLHAQKAPYLAEQIRAFRDGKRKNPTMEAMVKTLSEQDINAVALHFSSLPPVAPAAPAKK